MIFVVSYLRTYLTPAVIRKKLGGKDGLVFNFLASIAGVISPFCFCSTVPIFVGFVKSGVPLGVTFSFLITSPLVDLVALGGLFGAFGLNAGLLYGGMGALIGTIAGKVIGRLKLERYVESFVNRPANAPDAASAALSRKERVAITFSSSHVTFADRCLPAWHWNVTRRMIRCIGSRDNLVVCGLPTLC